MKRKVLSLLLSAACMASLLVGCEMTDSTEGAVEPAQEESQAEAAAGTEAADGEQTASADAVTLDLYLDFTWWPVESWTGIIPEELTKNGGVNFDVTRSADDSQLGLMIASGDLH